VKIPEDKPRWYFVDEAGDPTFYTSGKQLIIGTEGCSRTFSVGFLRTHDPQQIRSKLADIRLEVMHDRYLQDIPSVQKSLRAFHAKDDSPEVRKLVFSALDKMDFSLQIVVARKLEWLFQTRYDGSQDAFYDDLVTRLFERQMHLSKQNTIVFSRRGSKSRQHALRAAVEVSVRRFRERNPHAETTEVAIDTNQPAQETVLQAVDYGLWAVQRAFERGEMRYFEFLRPKIEVVWDIFDFKRIQKKGSVVYDRKRNPFNLDNVSPLG
jgi:hypothetical protein